MLADALDIDADGLAVLVAKADAVGLAVGPKLAVFVIADFEPGIL